MDKRIELFFALALLILAPISIDWKSSSVTVSTAQAACGAAGPLACTFNDVSESCQQGKSCTTDDTQALKMLSGCDPAVNIGGNSFFNLCSAQARLDGAKASELLKTTAAQNPTAAPVTCNGTWSTISNPGTCIARALFAGIGGFLIWIGVLVLSLAGYIFEFLLHATVTQFPAYFYTDAVKSAIEAAWGALRDLANILIIGIFVFVAINLILGNSGEGQFGQRRLIARVLLIAVLINFSLLFTKLIVDGSNFTAVQFYNATLVNIDTAETENISSVNNSSNTSAVGTNLNSNGIAASFMGFLGVSTFGDSYNALRKIQESNQSAFLALAYGLLSFIFLIAVAAVLLYGSFILVTRGLLIIFLILMSALAFATYLMPSNTIFVKKGWSLWWSSLLKTAVLAPVLMIMLWVTLTVADKVTQATALAMGGSGNVGTLGALMTASNPGANIAALFNFIIVLGLLFASFKISSMFANTISGFDFVGKAMSLAASVPLGATSRILGFAGRQTLGRAGAAVGASMQTKSNDESRSMLSRTLYDFGAQRAKGVAKRDFNLMRTPLGTGLQKAAGIKKLDTLAGKEVKGFEGSQQALADRKADQARRMTASAEVQEKQSNAIIENEIKRDPVLAQDHATVLQAKEAHEQMQKTEEGTLATMRDKNSQEMTKLSSDLEQAQKAAAAGIGSTAAVRAAETAVAAARTRQATAIDEQTAKIQRAKEMITAAERDQRDIEREAERRAKDTGRMPQYARDSRGRYDRRAQQQQTARSLINNRFTSGLFTQAENDRLADLASRTTLRKTNRQNRIDLGLADERSGSSAPRPPAGGGGGGAGGGGGGGGGGAPAT
jgi:hypothetical protein